MQEFIQNMPIYIQIMNEIKKRVAVGVLHAGDKLPSVREFAEEKMVNPNTIQRAYSELEREGVTETRRGMGTFITDDAALAERIRSELADAVLSMFIQEMREMGYVPKDILRAVTIGLEEQHGSSWSKTGETDDFAN